MALSPTGRESRQILLPIEAINGQQKRAGAPRPVLTRVPARAARKGLAWLRFAARLAGYHGIKTRVVSLATEAGRMAGLPIWKDACSNARAGSKRATFTECVVSSASRSSLLWVHEDKVSWCCLPQGWWWCGVLDAWARRRVLAARAVSSQAFLGNPWRWFLSRWERRKTANLLIREGCGG